MMKVLLTGRDGQLGQELQATVPDGVTPPLTLPSSQNGIWL